jgi:NADPH:quinone reductase
LLAPGGACVQFGSSAGGTVSFTPSAFYSKGRTALYGLQLFSELANQPASAGLATLSRLVSDQRLRPLISVEGSWQDIGEFAQELVNRRYPGKAVLRVE